MDEKKVVADTNIYDTLLVVSKSMEQLFNQRYRIFLFPGKSLTFTIFGQKSSEWVKIVYFFFPVLYFFFPALRIWVSEWILNFSWKKKIHKIFEKKIEKKYTSKIRKVPKNQHKVPFLDLFLQISDFFWVSGLQTFPGKK